MPPYGFHPPPPGPRYGSHTERGGKRRYSEREREREDSKRHDFHPWDHESEHVPKRKWSEDRERPKILTKDKDRRDTHASDPVERSVASDTKRTVSLSSEPSGTDSAHHVVLAGSKASPQEAEPNDLSPPLPAMRSQPKKIMLRKMGDSSKLDATEQQEKTEAGKATDRLSDVKSPHPGKSGVEQDSSEVSTAKPRPIAWKMTDRNSTTSPKTLYEPEGKKSEAKFRKYQHDARERGSGGGKREKAGSSPATTPSDTQPPAHIPDVGAGGKERGDEKVPLKRTFSSDRGREGEGRKGRDGDRQGEKEEERQWWNEPRKNHSDQQRDPSGPQRDHYGPRRDHSGPQREPRDHQRDHPKSHSDHPDQHRDYHEGRHQSGGRYPYDRQDSERQEWRASGRRERGRGSSKNRGSELMRDENREPCTLTTQPRVTGQPSNESECKSESKWQVQGDVEEGEGDGRKDKSTSDSEQRHYHGGVEQEGGQRGEEQGEHPNRTQRLPSRREGSKPKEDQKLSGKSVSCDEGKVPQSGVASATVTTAPASVPQSVINKSLSVSVQTSGRPPVSLPMPVPANYSNRPPRPPLLRDPPHSLRRIPVDTRPERRPQDLVDSRRRQDKRRGGGPDGSRGEGNRDRGGRGSQRRRGGRVREDNDQERQDNKQMSQPSTNVEKEKISDRGKPGGDKGRGDRRGRDKERRERGRGALARQASGNAEDSKPPAVSPEQSAEQSRRDGGRGRERRRRDRGSRTSESSYTQGEGSQRPPREAKESGPAVIADQRGDRKERDWGRGRHTKPSPTPEEKKGVKLDTGYGDFVEDIESGSDWELQAEVDQDKNVAKREGVGDATKLCADVSTSQPRGHGRGQRRREERQERAELLRSEHRVGTVRGRGRSVEQGRGRQGRPGSLKRGASRPGDKTESTHETKADHSPAATSRGDKVSGRKDVKTAQLEKPSVTHKQQEFAKYDLNSTKIAIVDDIGSQLQVEEVESTDEFVEVTSKKAQKEKVKKEREEQWRQAAELKEEQKKGRKPATTKPADQTTTSQLGLQPSTAWSSKGESDDGQSPQANIWGNSTAPSSHWDMVLRTVAGSAAPGAQFKETPPWPSMALGAGVGVIGEGLQARTATTALASQTEHLTAASGYSLFPMEHALSSLITAGPYAGSGGMLSAAVNMKLSQEHLPPSSGEPASSSHMGTVEDDVQEAVQVCSTESRELELPQSKPQVVKPVGTEPPAQSSIQEHPGTRAKADEDRTVPHGHGKSNLPPRLQSSRANPGSGVGRGRGGGWRARERKGERNRKGTERERREHDVPGERKKESQHRESRPRVREKVSHSSNEISVPALSCMYMYNYTFDCTLCSPSFLPL